MMTRRTLVILTIIIVLGLPLSFYGYLLLTDLNSQQKTNTTLPQINAPDLFQINKVHTNKELSGQMSLIVFWNSNCDNCAIEHGLLNYISKSKQVHIIGIDYKDKRYAAAKYLSLFGNPFDFVLLDSDGHLGLEFGITQIPTSYLTDAQGHILDRIYGPITPDTWYHRLAPKLNSNNHV